VHMAASWMPVCRDGIIRCKATVLRTTYRDLARTALESWHNERLYPKNHPWTESYEGGIDRPAVHKLRFGTIRDRSTVEVQLTMQFAAIGDAIPEQFIKGFETSMAWLNELDLFGERIPGLMFSRTGRYPSVDQIAPSELDRVTRDYRRLMAAAGISIEADDVVLPRLLWGDFNPPDLDHWLVKNLLEEPEKWPLYKLFRQPSGLAANAENRIGKPRSSYEQDLQTMTRNDARRYVYGEPGYSLDGRPVYEDEFALAVHRSDENLRPRENVPLAIGLDAGGSPAAAICQPLPTGQLLVLKEICAEPGTGPTRFAAMILECLMAEFPGLAVREIYADPSSFYGADRIAGELSWVEIVAQVLSLNIEPAPSNEPGLRQDAVRFYLGFIDARTPRMLIDPRCRRLIGGFAAHYKLTKQASAGSTDKLAVAKNEYSHVHDALQYVCLGHRGRYGAIAAMAQGVRGANVVPMRTQPTVVKGRKSVWDL